VKLVRQAATCYGRHLWSLLETPDGRRFINLDLIDKSGDQWGYKDMDESCGPCYYDCPLAFLDEATAPDNDFANDWRGKVRAFHQKASRKYAPNDVVLIYGKLYRVIEQVKRSYRVLRIADSRVYKCPPSKMTLAPKEA
jgi:hypothetical protein